MKNNNICCRKVLDGLPNLSKLSAVPVIAVNLAPSVFANIHALVTRGLYASPEQFLEIAAFNQVALERGAKPDDLPARPRSGDGAVHPPETRPSDVAAPGRGGSATRSQLAGRARRRNVEAPNLTFATSAFGLPGEHVAARTLATEPRPGSDRLWGQVNRLFPMKLVCRWLAASGPASIEETAPRLGEAAATLGSALEALDVAAGRKREDVLATGLPRAGNVASMERFLSQYLARTTRAGDIYPGAVSHYAQTAGSDRD